MGIMQGTLPYASCANLASEALPAEVVPIDVSDDSLPDAGDASAQGPAADSASSEGERDLIAGRLFGSANDAFLRPDPTLLAMAGKLIAQQGSMRCPSPLSAPVELTLAAEVVASVAIGGSARPGEKNSPQEGLLCSSPGSKNEVMRVFDSHDPDRITRFLVSHFSKNSTADLNTLMNDSKYRDQTQVPLLRALEHKNAEVRRNAARYLCWRLENDPAMADVLAARLNDPDVWVRLTIAGHLAERRDIRAIPHFVEILSEGRIDNMPSNWNEAVGPLIKALDHSNANVQQHAAYLLGKGSYLDAADALAAHLNDPDPKTASAMLRALGKLGDLRAVGPLIEGLSQRNDRPTFGFGRTTSSMKNHPLAKIPEAIGPLIEALDHPSANTRYWAAMFLKEVGGERVMEALAAHATDTDLIVRQQIVYILATLGDERAIPHLLEFRSHEDENVSRRAFNCLYEYSGSIKPLLHALDHANEHVRANSAEVLIRRWNRCNDEKERASLLREISNKVNTLSPERRQEAAARFLDAGMTLSLSGTPEKGTRQRLEKIVEKMARELSKRLGLGRIGSVVDANFDGYGEWSPGIMRMNMGFSLALTLDSVMAIIRIEEFSDQRQSDLMLRALNFVVHHEIAHLVIFNSQRFNLPGDNPHSSINADKYPAFTQAEVSGEASEIEIDGMAFDIGRRVYVHGDGDVMFDEQTREVISIRAALAFFVLVIDRHTSGEHHISNEVMARFVAVMGEMSESKAISLKTQEELKELTERYRNTVLAGADATQRGELVRQFEALVKDYRGIFREAADVRIGV
ncbi:MAG: HEAT repeat domain-containing protein [bacterium]